MYLSPHATWRMATCAFFKFVNSLLKKVSGTLPTTRIRAFFQCLESSRHLFQQAVSVVGKNSGGR